MNSMIAYNARRIAQTEARVNEILDYIRDNPGVRNCDVMSALSEYGVTAADVSNAKAQMKKKLGRRRSRTSGSTVDESVIGGETPAADPRTSISLVELEAAVEYVQSVGGVLRAQQLLALLQQIQSL